MRLQARSQSTLTVAIAKKQEFAQMKTSDTRRHMQGVVTFEHASVPARQTFCAEIAGRYYSREALRSAWDWYYKGWTNREANT